MQNVVIENVVPVYNFQVFAIFPVIPHVLDAIKMVLARHANQDKVQTLYLKRVRTVTQNALSVTHMTTTSAYPAPKRSKIESIILMTSADVNMDSMKIKQL